MDYWYVGSGPPASQASQAVNARDNGLLETQLGTPTGGHRSSDITTAGQTAPAHRQSVVTGTGECTPANLTDEHRQNKEVHNNDQLVRHSPDNTQRHVDPLTQCPASLHACPADTLSAYRGTHNGPLNEYTGDTAITGNIQEGLPLLIHTCDTLEDLDNLDLHSGPLATSTPYRKVDQGPDIKDPSSVPWFPRNRTMEWPAPREIADSYPELSHIYSRVLCHGIPNALAARIEVPSGLQLKNWYAIQTGHPHDQVVLDGITFGFSLQYEGPPIPSPQHIENHQSAIAHHAQVNKYVETELSKGAMMGPFGNPPFEWLHLSPLMTRPKSSSDEVNRRVIVDLSFPQEANVNMAIPTNTFYGVRYPHRLPTVDDLTAIVRADHFKGYMYAVDISRAYRNFPTDPLDWPLTGITHNGGMLIDLAMPFGARSSSLNMQLASQYILRHLHAKGIHALVYLDDLVGYSTTIAEASTHYTLVKDVMADLGLPLAQKKLTPPSRKITWLGITVDADKKTVSIPPSKIEETLEEMRDIQDKRKLCRKDVQRLAGRINHLAKACKPARLFMARILAYLRGHSPAYTAISQGVRPDLRWFLDFLPTYNGISLIPPATPSFNIEADSCLKGGGALGDGVCYMYAYPPQLLEAHISQLEAINCMATVRAIITPDHRGTTVLVECDNSAAVAVFSSGKGRDPVILACARAIWRHAADVDCALVFRHVPGEFMDAADALSRAPPLPEPWSPRLAASG